MLIVKYQKYLLIKKDSLPKWLLFIVVSLNSISVNATPNKIVPGESDLTLNGRPSQPYDRLENYNSALIGSGVGSQFTVPVSRHHIIPFNVLRQFYNNIIHNSQHMLRIRSFFLTLSTNIPYYAPNSAYCVTFRNELEAAMTLSEALSHQLITHGGGRFTPGLDTFQQFIAWLPGNLFIGPTNRNDDPGDGFEINVEEVVGTQRFAVLQRLYSQMVLYNHNVANSYTQDNNLLIASIATDLNLVSQTRRITPLNANNWEKKDGKYQLKKNDDSKLAVNFIEKVDTISPECLALHSYYNGVLGEFTDLFDKVDLK